MVVYLKDLSFYRRQFSPCSESQNTIRVNLLGNHSTSCYYVVNLLYLHTQPINRTHRSSCYKVPLHEASITLLKPLIVQPTNIFTIDRVLRGCTKADASQRLPPPFAPYYRPLIIKHSDFREASIILLKPSIVQPTNILTIDGALRGCTKANTSQRPPPPFAPYHRPPISHTLGV